MTTTMQLRPLGQLLGPQAWRLNLQHDEPNHFILWMNRGQGRITVNGVLRGLGANNVIHLPPRTLFSLDPGAQAQAQVLRISLDLGRHLPDQTVHLRLRDALTQGSLTAIFEALQRELTQSGPMSDVALRAQTDLLAVWLARQQITDAADAPAHTAATKLARQFAARVIADYASVVTMGDYAKALNVTPTHLTRVLRATGGMSAADVLTQRRLYEARLQLTDSTRPVRAIASDLGFNSAAYFSRFMMHHTGKTPTALRATT